MQEDRDLIQGSGYHPPATIALALAMVAVGCGIIALGTSVLKTPGGAPLSTGMMVFKGLAGLMVIGAGAGLYMLAPWSRAACRFLILVGGVLLPLYPLQTKFIDWEFLTTLRMMLVLTSLVAVLYLSRTSVAYALENGGVPVRFEGYYCAGCNAPFPEHPGEDCAHCGGPIFRIYRSVGGVAYAREADPA